MKKKRIIIICFIVLLCVSFISILDTKFKEIKITEDFITGKIDTILPIIDTNSIVKIIEVVSVISEIKLDFEEGQINLLASGYIIVDKSTAFKETKALVKNILKKNNPENIDIQKKIIFSMKFKGTPRYLKNAIYLTVHDFEIIDLQLDSSSVLRDSKEKVSGALIKVAEIYLNRYPVYKLPDDFKSSLVKASIKEIEFKNDLCIIHFSLWGLIGKMVWAFVALVIVVLASVGILIVSFLDPEILDIKNIF